MKQVVFSLTFIFVMQAWLFGQFQGVITLRTSNAATTEKSDVIWTMKNAYHRMDMRSVSEQGSLSYSLFFEPSSAQCWMLSDGNTIEIPANHLQSQTCCSFIFFAQPTGQQREWAGYVCQEYRLTAPNGYALCWISTTAPTIDFPTIFKNQGILLSLQQQRIIGTPLVAYVYDTQNNEVYNYEIVAIQSGQVSDQQIKRP